MLHPKVSQETETVLIDYCENCEQRRRLRRRADAYGCVMDLCRGCWKDVDAEDNT